MSEVKRNFAFISYNHRDVGWAKWLRRRLEWYRLPSEIHNEFENSRYIRPVFRDRDELNTGVLNDELRARLEASKYLIVVCSPNSAQSVWVSDEVEAFIEMGRLEYIIPFIVDGTPYSYDSREAALTGQQGECMPASLRVWNSVNPDKTLLGIAVADDGGRDRDKAFIRLVSRMLGVEFDTLWNRRKREIRLVATASALLCMVVLTVTYWFAFPVRLKVRIADEHSGLPPMERGCLHVNGHTYEVTSADTVVEVDALPGYNRLRDIRISFVADRYYEAEERLLRVTAGIGQEYGIYLRRDDTFALFAGRVIDQEGSPVRDVVLCIGGHEVTSDDEGRFMLRLPLSEQSVTKSVTVTHEGYQSLVREDESPGDEIVYVLHKER